jgi:ubiquinone/menaquinone biosynthesis C-methylase UbiE
LQPEIDRYWQEEANLFDGFYTRGDSPLGGFVGNFLHARVRQLIPMFQAGIHPGDKVLDVGCGSGWYLELLLRMGADVTGVDYSAEMLRISRDRLAGWDAARWRLLQADARSLDLPDAGFDAAIAVGLLDYLPDPTPALCELHRVLRFEGRLIATIPKRPSPFFVLRTRPGNLLRRRLLGLPPILTAVTRAELQALVAKTGFVLQELESVQATMWIVNALKLSSAEGETWQRGLTGA